MLKRPDPFQALCPTRRVLDRIGDTWAVLILIALDDGTLRFNELRRRIENISQKMLSQTLKSLERDGLMVILKTTYDESLDKALSPAFLLHHDQLRRVFGEGRVRRIEYYGRFMEWHSRWTEHKRVLHHLTCYRWGWLQRLRHSRAAG